MKNKRTELAVTLRKRDNKERPILQFTWGHSSHRKNSCRGVEKQNRRQRAFYGGWSISFISFYHYNGVKTLDSSGNVATQRAFAGAFVVMVLMYLLTAERIEEYKMENSTLEET